VWQTEDFFRENTSNDSTIEQDTVVTCSDGGGLDVESK
jgi:hypothetical protein